MGIENDPGLLGVDTNWRAPRDESESAEQEPRSFGEVMETTRENPDFKALDAAAQADVEHVLSQLLDKEVTHGVMTLTPEADGVVANALGMGRGYLGGTIRGNDRYSYMTTAFPNVARVTIANENTGVEKYAYAVIPKEGKKPWEA